MSRKSVPDLAKSHMNYVLAPATEQVKGVPFWFYETDANIKRNNLRLNQACDNELEIILTLVPDILFPIYVHISTCIIQ